ncbi:MAG: helix-hairpin-helix domain-containing protein [Acidobacteria bacterium]|nr:helix-hairpin-helix domain-containing protein [Acidobacteriota bacterium]
MFRTVVILFVIANVSACSTRVEYSRSGADVSPTAVNINTATADDLERLPHIGRKTAEAIVAFREKHGPFQRPEQVMLIRGMSETRYLEMRELLRTE